MLDYRSTSALKVQRSAVSWINTLIEQASLWEGEFIIWLNLFFYNKLKNQHHYTFNNVLMNNTHLIECHESKVTYVLYYAPSDILSRWCCKVKKTHTKKEKKKAIFLLASLKYEFQVLGHSLISPSIAWCLLNPHFLSLPWMEYSCWKMYWNVVMKLK